MPFEPSAAFVVTRDFPPRTVGVEVCSIIRSLAFEYSTQRVRDSRSIGEIFQRRSGSSMRALKRRSCSSSLTENQYLTSWMPDPTSMRSNSGTVCRNSQYSASVQKPITRSTPARLYQDRSNRIISPAAGSSPHVALEVPLRPLALGRRGQRDDATKAGVERSRDTLDRAPLAGRVTALEDDDQPLTALTDPMEHLHELELESRQLLLVGLARHLWLIGTRVAGGFVGHRFSFRAD